MTILDNTYTYSDFKLFREQQGIKTEITNEKIVCGSINAANALINEANIGNLYARAFYIIWLWRSDLEKPNSLIRENRGLALELSKTTLPTLIEKAKLGDIDCLFLYARHCDFGVGEVEMDEAEAIRYYTIAAKYGHNAARNNLGIAYAAGSEKGIKKSNIKAVKCWELAAKEGHAVAQYNLALMYREGRGVIKDNKRFLYWCQKSAAQGYTIAHSELQRLT